MSGWVPMVADWWPSVVNSMPDVWPRGAALFDLRWHVDRDGAISKGRKQWRDRWGWSDWDVRKLLQGEEWVDEYKLSQTPPEPLPTDSRNSGAGASPAMLPLPTHSQPTPNPLHTRVPTQAHSQDTEEEPHPTDKQIKQQAEQDAQRAKARTVYETWKGQKNPDGSPAHPESRLFRKTDQGTVNQRIKEYGVEAVVRVVQWAHQCPESWWYQKQAWGLDTLTRAKGFGDKVKEANAWTPGTVSTAGDWAKVLELATMSAHAARQVLPGDGYRERAIRSAAGSLSKMDDRRIKQHMPGIRALFERRIAARSFEI